MTRRRFLDVRTKLDKIHLFHYHIYSFAFFQSIKAIVMVERVSKTIGLFDAYSAERKVTENRFNSIHWGKRVAYIYCDCGRKIRVPKKHENHWRLKGLTQ